MTNLWNNRIVGDLQPGEQKSFARTNLKKRFSAKTPLLPFGLLGPVRIRAALDVKAGF